MNGRTSRRRIVAAASGAAAWLIAPRISLGMRGQDAHFVAEAERIRQQAIASGDQPYGEVLVRARSSATAPAGSSSMEMPMHMPNASHCGMRSSGRATGDSTARSSTPRRVPAPSASALAQAGVARMRFGPEANDGGPPQDG